MAASAKQIDNLVSLIDGYAEEGGYHLNVIVLKRYIIRCSETSRKLSSAYNPCIRMAVNFKLKKNSRMMLFREI